MAGKSSIAAALLAAAPLLLAPGGAAAHHVVSELGIAPVLPRSTAGVDASAANFDLEGQRGSWQALTVALEWSLGRRLSFFGALPFARLAVDGSDPAVGIGDAAVSAKLALYASEHGGLLLSAGLGAELPTGNHHNGLGGGHVELVPFVAASSALGHLGRLELVTFVIVSPRFSLASHDDGGGGAAAMGEVHGSLLAPHGDREVFGRALAALAYGAGYAGAGAEGATVLEGSGSGYLALRGEAGYLLGASLRLMAGVDGTVAGDHRFGLRARLGALWLF
jgi:hypothetical protein